MSQRPVLNALLLLCLACLPLSFGIIPLQQVALAPQAPLWHHLTYHFAHLGPLHWLLNCSALLSIAFHFRLTWCNLLVAYIVCSLLPSFSTLSVVGLSAIVYYLLGRCALAVARPRRFALLVLLSIACGLLLPRVAVSLHFAAFLAGLLLAALNYPAFRR